VNLIFVAEGDEERMSIGYRQFIRTHPELFKGADAMYRFGSQASAAAANSPAAPRAASTLNDDERCEVGPRPTVSDIHGGNKRSVDSPAWRHIQMLKTLVSEDGNKASSTASTTTSSRLRRTSS
jgi:hypothetical protein